MVTVASLDNDPGLAGLAGVAAVGLDGVPALNYAVLEISIVADMNSVKDNGILDGTVIAYINLLEDNGILNLAVYDGTACNQTVPYLCARIVLCGRKVVNLGVDVRILPEEVIPDIMI